MDEERRRDDGEDEARALRVWATVAARQAQDVLRRAADDPARPVALSRTIEHLAAIERLLPADDPLRDRFVPLLGVMVCMRFVGRGTDDTSEDARLEREHALRHLRWADRTRPLTDPFAVKARSALLQLLVPEHCARAMRAWRHGPRRKPPLRASGSFRASGPRPPTAPSREDLAEAREVLKRLTARPGGSGPARDPRVPRVGDRAARSSSSSGPAAPPGGVRRSPRSRPMGWPPGSVPRTHWPPLSRAYCAGPRTTYRGSPSSWCGCTGPWTTPRTPPRRPTRKWRPWVWTGRASPRCASC
ncbi:hypothetical protein ACFQ10_09325 [Streptomyces indonesiensis]